jgi:hypothetical protein
MTIDTHSSFVAGYAVAAILLTAYTVSLYVRSRRVRARVEELRTRRPGT